MGLVATPGPNAASVGAAASRRRCPSSMPEDSRKCDRSTDTGAVTASRSVPERVGMSTSGIAQMCRYATIANPRAPITSSGRMAVSGQLVDGHPVGTSSGRRQLGSPVAADRAAARRRRQALSPTCSVWSAAHVVRFEKWTRLGVPSRAGVQSRARSRELEGRVEPPNAVRALPRRAGCRRPVAAGARARVRHHPCPRPVSTSGAPPEAGAAQWRHVRSRSPLRNHSCLHRSRRSSRTRD